MKGFHTKKSKMQTIWYPAEIITDAAYHLLANTSAQADS